VITVKSLFFCLALLLISGCSDKKEERAQKRDSVTETDIILPSVPKETNHTENNTTPLLPEVKTEEHVTVLTDINGTQQHLILESNRFILRESNADILLVTLFSTWCPPCRGQLPYFQTLQKKYPRRLNMLGVLVNDDANASQLKTFYDTYHIDYFVSVSSENRKITAHLVPALKLSQNFRLPLTILYKNHTYYTHYEGAVPAEMIDHDIHNALDAHP